MLPLSRCSWSFHGLSRRSFTTIFSLSVTPLQTQIPGVALNQSITSFGHMLSIKLQINNLLLWNQQVQGIITFHKRHQFVVNPQIPTKYRSEVDQLADVLFEECQLWLIYDQLLFPRYYPYFLKLCCLGFYLANICSKFGIKFLKVPLMLRGLYCFKWLEAMQQEYNVLLENHTLVYVRPNYFLWWYVTNSN